MNNLYLFNTDSDLALADFTEHYMAPALIRQMSDELAVLPMWYALPGSGVLASSAYNWDFLKRMKGLFSMEVDLVTWPELADGFEGHFKPWGWNPAVRKRLVKAGALVDSLPTLSELADMRRLASREVALSVLADCADLPQVCGAGSVLRSVESCREYWLQQGGRCLFKAPWSGSGKGLLWCYSDFSVSVAGWCQRILSAQELLIGMPIYNKVCDFAMEFQSDGRGRMDFSGFSFFETNPKGAYQGNWLALDETIEQRLAEYVPKDTLRLIRQRVQGALQQHFRCYAGYLGVDMMICSLSDGTYAVCPCVEVNLRMNMGLVARLFADRYLSDSSEGVFRVEAFDSTQALHEAHEADEKLFPLVVQNGKLQQGYLPLVPVTPKSRYRVYAKVFPSKKK